uniref:S-ribosylhomocysteine lyase (Autoinducer-2 production protein LuxS)) n=1 Tax=Ganoderma boninense TaxID=34458 RepID=A0A5K1JY74_9APHY|nr:S-ribosylhomocysteine lyase (EC (AI-2 synthesis protein) (Autoinducer-2 production protein LuxS) [Ganoderma boninense]
MDSRLASKQSSTGFRRNRRLAKAGTFALAYMTTTSLLAWRLTCRDNHVYVGNHLRSSLYRLVNRFFPDPVAFLNILTPWGALIVGEAALSHVLQEPVLCDVNFEVAVSNLHFDSFLESLRRLFPLGSNLLSPFDRPSPEGFPYHRNVTRISEFRLLSGMFITVYESSTPSACDVLAGCWSTALMNFATAYTMGSAYPRLTFNNLALICDSRVSSMEWSERNVQRRLAVYGFDSSHKPDHWPLGARRTASTTSAELDLCGKSLYVCPQQGRFFGDPGSLVIFYDGLLVDIEALRDLCVPPYGPMAAWRLPSSVPPEAIRVGLYIGVCAFHTL